MAREMSLGEKEWMSEKLSSSICDLNRHISEWSDRERVLEW